MSKYKLEYIWLDGYEPTPNLRSKTKIVDFDAFPTLEELPMWNFDGSSTQQAEGRSSDCLLKPVAVFPDSTRKNGALVMCEVLLPDGTPHPTNARATIMDDPGAWFGFEQVYFLMRNGRPLGCDGGGYPDCPGEYYAGVGYRNAGNVARRIVEEHLDICLDAGITHQSSNAEVAKGQWGFQTFGKGSKSAADQVWIARYLLERLCERYSVDPEWHSKPIEGDWNGSGLHCSFSTEFLRGKGGQAYFEELMEAFYKYHNEHIAAYGPDDPQRFMPSTDEQSLDKFNYGVARYGVSIRLPHTFVNSGYKGYLEDRRPNSAGDAYKIVSRILQTLSTVPTASGSG